MYDWAVVLMGFGFTVDDMASYIPSVHSYRRFLPCFYSAISLSNCTLFTSPVSPHLFQHGIHLSTPPSIQHACFGPIPRLSLLATMVESELFIIEAFVLGGSTTHFLSGHAMGKATVLGGSASSSLWVMTYSNWSMLIHRNIQPHPDYDHISSFPAEHSFGDILFLEIFLL